MISIVEFMQERLTTLTSKREALLRECTKLAMGNFDEQEALILELSKLQGMHQLYQTMCVLAVYGSAVGILQYSRFIVSSHPWCPALTGLGAALQRLRAERGERAAAAATPELQMPRQQRQRQQGAAQQEQRARVAGESKAGSEQGREQQGSGEVQAMSEDSLPTYGNGASACKVEQTVSFICKGARS